MLNKMTANNIAKWVEACCRKTKWRKQIQRAPKLRDDHTQARRQVIASRNDIPKAKTEQNWTPKSQAKTQLNQTTAAALQAKTKTTLRDGWDWVGDFEVK